MGLLGLHLLIPGLHSGLPDCFISQSPISQVPEAKRRGSKSVLGDQVKGGTSKEELARVSPAEELVMIQVKLWGS